MSTQASNYTMLDRLYIQEVMNDMARKGNNQGKAWDMLRAWSRELRERTDMRGRTKRTFYHKRTGNPIVP